MRTVLIAEGNWGSVDVLIAFVFFNQHRYLRLYRLDPLYWYLVHSVSPSYCFSNHRFPLWSSHGRTYRTWDFLFPQNVLPSFHYGIFTVSLRSSSDVVSLDVPSVTTMRHSSETTPSQLSVTLLREFPGDLSKPFRRSSSYLQVLVSSELSCIFLSTNLSDHRFF